MKAILMMITISTLFLGGCATTGMSGAFDKDGLPKQQYYVGGGFSINYRAQGVPGNVYVVEENVHMRLKEVGIDPLNLEFSLYFVPQQQAEEVSDK